MNKVLQMLSFSVFDLRWGPCGYWLVYMLSKLAIFCSVIILYEQLCLSCRLYSVMLVGYKLI